ncbi:hypothetical protein [Anaerocolumna sp. MB42-C2]|uniref:hypothetical protein n=1 Tax=Anaerocolumna sp. MB42-C2 TaxID=3070997 RepID=UPI0027DFE4A8|nr:hypothetical protein [Anaerocolumna sp. MB42-C2]WMJ86864.1 hypothetical protein RBU59_22950 [Anaerocolumna sp. MB42-C2]
MSKFKMKKNKDKYVSAYCNCSKILKKFHSLIYEAEELYKKSDAIIDTKVVEAIYIATESLERAFELGGQGEETENNAYKMLDKSECGNTCDKNSTECKELDTKAQEMFSLESDYLTHALNSLKDAQKDIQISMVERKIGYKLRDQYKKCIHSKKSTSD